jgi:adenylate kinase family enzyme
MIIHISGPSGSGKTTIGKWIKSKNINNVKILDLDDILHKHIEKLEKSDKQPKYIFKNFNDLHQKLIDNIIDLNKNKILIFVGISFDLEAGRPVEFRGSQEFLHNLYYDVKADHKYYIDISSIENMRQLFYRSIDELCHDKKWYFDEWVKNPKQTEEMLTHVLDISHWKRNKDAWDSLYKKNHYKFMSFDNLKKEILKLIK